MEKTASQVLRVARALIDSPDKWLQGDYCNISGDRFCAYGAIRNASGYESDDQPAVDYFKSATDGRGFLFNDNATTTHAMVMAAFDRAIALAEADEAPQRKPREDDATWAARMVSEVTKQGGSVGTTPASFTADEVATNK